MPAPLVVRSVQIQSKKSLLGKITHKASFECPHCKSKLVAGEEEICKPDTCPSCGGEFILPKEAAEKIRRLNESDEAAARSQAIAEQKQKEELASKKRQEQETEKRNQHEAVNADFIRRKIAAESQGDERRSGLDQEKAAFRNYGIRKYTTLESLVNSFLGLQILIIALMVIYAFAVVVQLREYIGQKVPTIVFVAGGMSIFGAIVGTSVCVFVLQLMTELIKLSINLAQDTERLLQNSESEAGKPWAPK